MKRTLKVVLVAGESAGALVLQAVVGAGCQLEALMIGDGESERKTRATAERSGHPVWPAEWVKDPQFADRVRAASVDVLLNVHSLYIIRPEVLEAPRIGSFNMHPGPLPEIAGLNAVSWALYDGRSTHGVTIHRMVPKVDAGPIAYQTRFPVDEQDTALTLSVKCVKAGVPLITELLETATATPDAVPQLSQDLSRRRYYGKEVPQGGRLVWARPARDVVNFVRACDYGPFASPWGHPRTRLNGQELAVLKASLSGEPCGVPPGTVGDARGRTVAVAARDEWVLVHQVLCESKYVYPSAILAPGRRFAEPT